MSEAFLSRWSRMKKTAGETPVVEPLAVTPVVDAEKAVIPAAQNEPVLENISQNLPAVESLTDESDFTAFMQPKVPEALKRQALKKLFANPQFNVMDGLDVYVDDYSVSVPIPDDWYKDIPSWQAMLNPKPPMVVTDGGYAVEADSEEGVATTKAREAIAADALESKDAVVAQPPSPSIPPLQGEGGKEPLSQGERGRGEGEKASLATPIAEKTLQPIPSQFSEEQAQAAKQKNN